MNCQTCISVSVILIAILITYLAHLARNDSLTEAGNSFAAHVSCTILFGTDRDLNTAKQAEFVFPPIIYGRRFNIDKESRCVTASFVLRQDVSTTYCFTSERLGCSRQGTHTSDTYEDRLQHAKVIEKSRKIKWPMGEIIDTTKLQSEESCLAKVAYSHFEGDTQGLHSRALLIVQDNEIIYEKYRKGWNHMTRLHGWSMTKSLLNALIGIRIQQGKLTLETTLGSLLPIHMKVHLDNTELTITDLLCMIDGFDFDEIYQPGSGTVSMLFESPSLIQYGKNIGQRRNEKNGQGKGCFQYSSLTSNYLSAALKGTFDTQEEYLNFPTKFLFEPLGMNTALIETDSEGIFIASSFSWMTARDWARIGMLFGNDGIWENKRILPIGWVDMSRSPTATTRNTYGMHFWLGGLKDSETKEDDRCDLIYPERIKKRNALRFGFPKGTMLMKGFEDQIVAIHPEKKSIIVRLGATKPVVIKWNEEKFYKDLYKCLDDDVKKHR
tara:strand:- start:431 stop:1918 length:1488 start_codon:yes stop_codon:yes gene_type:complete